MDLYRNTDILQGDTLTMCMKIRVFPMGSFGFVWKYAYLQRHPQDLHENIENLWKCCSNALIRIEMKSKYRFSSYLLGSILISRVSIFSRAYLFVSIPIYPYPFVYMCICYIFFVSNLSQTDLFVSIRIYFMLHIYSYLF